MKRREFLTGLGGAAAAWPLNARAQPGAMPVIGFLHGESASRFKIPLAGFHMGLKDGGFVEGQNLTIEYRWAESNAERLPAMAADLVRRRVAAIVALSGTQFVAKSATATIPILFATGGDPVRMGLVASLCGDSKSGVASTLFQSGKSAIFMCSFQRIVDGRRPGKLNSKAEKLFMSLKPSADSVNARMFGLDSFTNASFAFENLVDSGERDNQS